MSFKFDLQTFAYTNDGNKYKFIDDESMVIKAEVGMRPYTYFAWMIENIEDLDTINSMSESTSAKKDYWNKDRKVSQLLCVFSTYISSYAYGDFPNYALPKKYDLLSSKYPNKEFKDIAYFNNALSHMKLQDNSSLHGAFAGLGISSAGENNNPEEIDSGEELNLTLLDFEKVTNMDYMLKYASVNVDITGIKLNPNLKHLNCAFNLKNGYVKGILDIDYSNIEDVDYSPLPDTFYTNKNLKVLLGDDNKVIRFSKPPKKIKKLSGFFDITTYIQHTEDSEYILDISNWNLKNLYIPTDGNSFSLFNSIYCKEIIFPEGFVYYPIETAGNLLTAYSIKKITNLAIDFSKLELDSKDQLYRILNIFSLYDYEGNNATLDADCKIKFINFDETKLYSFYKDPDNGYDGEDYTLETFYKDYIMLPKENIEFVNKK